VFSFQAVKNLPTADSGMICFKEQADDEFVRKLTWLGINKDTYARTAAQGAYKWMYDVEEIGYKYHGNSIMAAIGLVSLKYLDHDNAYRRQMAKWYKEELEGATNLRIVETAPECESAQHLFQIRATNRNDLLAKLNENEIFPGVHYRDNTHYKMYEYGHANCPNARRISDEILSLPMHMDISREDIRVICRAIRQFSEYSLDMKQAA
jgi:dTDP-4-amino-4,6-dideoxygalactose transaminase